jgi:hypothetical protein
VVCAQREGQIRAGEDPAFIALSIFFLYSGAVRYWIAAARPNPGKGIEELQRLLDTHLSGVRGVTVAPPAAAPRRKIR